MFIAFTKLLLTVPYVVPIHSISSILQKAFSFAAVIQNAKVEGVNKIISLIVIIIEILMLLQR